jgi:hypothetical protein
VSAVFISTSSDWLQRLGCSSFELWIAVSICFIARASLDLVYLILLAGNGSKLLTGLISFSGFLGGW